MPARRGMQGFREMPMVVEDSESVDVIDGWPGQHPSGWSAYPSARPASDVGGHSRSTRLRLIGIHDVPLTPVVQRDPALAVQRDPAQAAWEEAPAAWEEAPAAWEEAAGFSQPHRGRRLPSRLYAQDAGPNPGRAIRLSPLSSEACSVLETPPSSLTPLFARCSLVADVLRRHEQDHLSQREEEHADAPSAPMEELQHQRPMTCTS